MKIATTQKASFIKGLLNRCLKFLRASPMKIEAGNIPNNAMMGTMIKKPPCPSIVSENLPRLFLRKKPFVHSPLVALCTSQYHGIATNSIMMPAKRIFQEKISFILFSQINQMKMAPPGNAIATGPFANVPNPMATAQISNQ